MHRACRSSWNDVPSPRRKSADRGDDIDAYVRELDAGSACLDYVTRIAGGSCDGAPGSGSRDFPAATDAVQRKYSGGGVWVEPEMETGRSPLLSMRLFGVGIFEASGTTTPMKVLTWFCCIFPGPALVVERVFRRREFVRRSCAWSADLGQLVFFA